VLKVAINVPAEVLRRRITARVERMIRAGLIAEVATLVQRYGGSAPGLQTIGYREVLPYLAGRWTLRETNAAIVRATWQYARRQYTWLRKEPQLVFASSPSDARRIIVSWLSRGK
jgi:tRNA dimethylallyltransferase